MKYFRMSYETVIWDISFSNINMLLATIPMMETDSSDPDAPQSVESLSELENLFKD